VGGVLNDRRVVMVDDSIVRGTTIKGLVKRIRKAGAKEVHIRVTSPPIKYPCYYGMDFPTKEELIANGRSVSEIAKYLGVNSLEYLSLEMMLNAMPKDNGQNYCTACFDGNYPVSIKECLTKEKEQKD
ncbi:MAG: amidophosphoribosyltransferase, partial [Calditrichia bacterium]|nr:amidophosphoribosyltransferase [Calditrichia bacterium]